MLVFKKILFYILAVVDAYFLYATIGYLILGIQSPKILGGVKTTFMGMYMMSITFFCLFAVATTVIIIIAIKYFKSKKK